MRVACFYFSTPVELGRVAEDALRFSPQIALKEPDAVFLEIGKCRRLYSEEDFLRKAATIFRRLGQPVALGIGDSLEWALLAAKFGSTSLAALPVESLFDLADPLGRDEKAVPFVSHLVESLGRLGVYSLADFRAVPREELSARFGAVGLLCRQKLDGELLSPWKPWRPPEVIREGAAYQDFAATLEPLLFEAKRLLDRIFTRLRFRGLSAAALLIELKCEKLSINPEPARELSLAFLLPQTETKGTLAILRDFFAKEFTQRPLLSSLEEFAITVSQTTPGFAAQKNLYHSREEKREAYAAFVSQLSQLYGRESTYQAQTVEERLPEFSWEKVPEAKAPAEMKHRIPLRPTHLTKPEPVEVGREFIQLRRKRFRILRWSESIERISSGWLHAAVERTYFQVEVEGGPLLWIYGEAGDRYFLHGYYG